MIAEQAAPAGLAGTASRAAAPASAWSHALYLHERLPPAERSLAPEALAAGLERARAWRAASGADDETFAWRLAEAGLEWDEFVRVLGAAEAGHEPKPRDARALDWLEVVDEVGLGTHEGVELPVKVWRNPDGSEGTEPPFSSFIRPFLKAGVARLRAGVARIEAGRPSSEPLYAPRVELQLMLDLVERLTKRFSGTLILELNVARLRDQLVGDTPTERFRHFSERHFDRARCVELLAEYPVLARLMSVALVCWAEATLEFLARLAADRGTLGPLLAAPGEDAPAGLRTLAEVRTGAGDPHRGGRTVIIAEDVDGRCVVYKPVPLAVDACMERLVDGVNRMGMRHPLRAVRAADRGAYGWIEYARVAECRSAEELGRFYWRQGSLLALVHAVRGADFHYENLLACGEHPVLLDNEGLFHNSPATAPGKGAYHAASATLAGSVLRQAFLPHVFRFTPDATGIDPSGLGGAAGQVARGVVRRWADPATDQMRVVPADLVTQQAQNLPSLGGRTASALDHLPEIVRGFAETYDLLSARRAEVAPLLDAFAGAPVRQLVRPTRQYTTYLREGYHPNDLRDGLDRDALLDRLWPQAAADPLYRPVVAAEAEDLRTGDVPAFQARPDSRDLWDSRGCRVEGFFAEGSLDEARRQLAAMSAEERDRQLLLVRLSISEARDRARAAESAAAPSAASPPEPALAEPAPPEALRDAALAVGEALGQRALVGPGGACWISVDPFVEDGADGPRPRNVALARSDLYHGTAGIALFLGYLGALTGRGEHTELAREAVRTLREAVEWSGPGGLDVVGAFLGRASYSYALQHLAALWNEPALLDLALADLPRLATLVPADREYDLMGGSAGCALVALQLHRATGDPAALGVARACGDHLLAAAQPAHGGLAWTGGSFAGPVAGLAHGAAGIAWALSELAGATGDERYLGAAGQGVAFERALLASAEGAGFHRRVSWCHGLPSVALGRIVSAGAHGDAQARVEVEAGAARLMDAGAPGDPCLCHGVLGNAEILAAAGRHLAVPGWERHAAGWVAGVAAGVARDGGDPYLPLHARFAGVMCGLAGVGLGLLRAAYPGRVPSVLALEPPPATRG